MFVSFMIHPLAMRRSFTDYDPCTNMIMKEKMKGSKQNLDN